MTDCVSVGAADVCIPDTRLLLWLIPLSDYTAGLFFSPTSILTSLEDGCHTFRCLTSVHIIEPNAWAFLASRAARCGQPHGAKAKEHSYTA